MKDGTQISSEQQDGEAAALFKVGELVDGTYLVVDLIGRGGMGVVYRAEHTIMKKSFALKALNRELLSPEIWQRFQNEARVLGRLKHENIVSVQNCGVSSQGIPYFVMDLLTGQSLADRLKDRGRLPLAEALPIFRQVCDALAYAHEKGVVHRDIKPDNIMLEGDLVKLVDFGLAKAIAEGQDQGLTRAGHIFGSPLYMSPEQGAGAAVDQRSDIYSVGCSLYETLTGEPPYRGDTATATIMMHHNATLPRLTEKCPGVQFPEKLEEITARLLAKEKKDRYQSLSKVATELREIELLEKNAPKSHEIQKEEEEEAAALSRKSGKRHYLIVATGLAITTLLIAAAAVLLPRPEHALNQPQLGAKSGSQSGPQSGSQPGPQIAPQSGSQSAPSVVAPEAHQKERVRSQAEELALTELKEIKQFSVDSPAADGKIYRTFTFPKSADLGQLTDFSGQNNVDFDAIDKVKVRWPAKIEFTPNELFLQDAKNFRKFKTDDFSELSLSSYDGNLHEILKELSAIKSIKVLRLNQAFLQDEDLPLLDNLTSVDKLEIAGTKISEEKLAKSPFLLRLRFLKIDKLKPHSKVLETLTQSKHLTSLYVVDSQLTESDWKAIASMKDISNLDVTGTNLDDRAVETLTPLKWLREFDMSRTKVTPACARTFKKFPNLHEVRDDNTHWTAEQEKAFERTLAPINVEMGRDRLFIQ